MLVYHGGYTLTFADITDKKHDHYKKDWQEIYKILQSELNI